MIEHGQKDAEFDAYSRAYDQAVNDSIAFTGLSVDYFTRVKQSERLRFEQAQDPDEFQRREYFSRL